MFKFIVILAVAAVAFAQTGENFCQTGIVNTTGTTSICSSGSFTACSPYPGVAQQQANIITNNMTSITQAGQVSKGNNACSFIGGVGTAAWTTPALVCPPLPASTCTLGAACEAPTAPLTPPANASLPCCSELRYFARLWCTGPNMINVETEIVPGSNKISGLTYLPGLGQVMNCQLCTAAPTTTTTTAAPTTTTTTAATTTTTTVATTTTAAAATTTTAAVAATTATNGTVVGVGSTVSGGPNPTTASAAATTTTSAKATTTTTTVKATTTTAAPATTTTAAQPVTTTTAAGTVSAAAVTTTANVVATTASLIQETTGAPAPSPSPSPAAPSPSPAPGTPAATPSSLIGETATPSSGVRASASMLAVIALPLIVAALL